MNKNAKLCLKLGGLIFFLQIVRSQNRFVHKIRTLRFQQLHFALFGTYMLNGKLSHVYLCKTLWLKLDVVCQLCTNQRRIYVDRNVLFSARIILKTS